MIAASYSLFIEQTLEVNLQGKSLNIFWYSQIVAEISGVFV